MKDNFGVLQALALLSQIGITIIVPVIAGVYLGNKIDVFLGTKAIFLVVFIILGVLVGFRSAYRLLMKGKNRKG